MRMNVTREEFDDIMVSREQLREADFLSWLRNRFGNELISGDFEIIVHDVPTIPWLARNLVRFENPHAFFPCMSGRTYREQHREQWA